MTRPFLREDIPVDIPKTHIRTSYFFANISTQMALKAKLWILRVIYSCMPTLNDGTELTTSFTVAILVDIWPFSQNLNLISAESRLEAIKLLQFSTVTILEQTSSLENFRLVQYIWNLPDIFSGFKPVYLMLLYIHKKRPWGIVGLQYERFESFSIQHNQQQCQTTKLTNTIFSLQNLW